MQQKENNTYLPLSHVNLSSQNQEALEAKSGNEEIAKERPHNALSEENFEIHSSQMPVLIMNKTNFLPPSHGFSQEKRVN